VKGIQNSSYEGQPPSPRGDNSERVKYPGNVLRIFFFRTRTPISTWYKSSIGKGNSKLLKYRVRSCTKGR
jgi:hypothetical protein